VADAFFESAGTDSFVATSATCGPWDPRAQHGGPPSALAARALQRHEPDEGQRLARVAVDIMRPVPVGKLTVRTRTVRPGRRVAMLETVVEADGQEVLHARGWRIAFPGGPVPVTEPYVPPPIPEEQAGPAFAGANLEGYLTAVDWRFVAGISFDTPGPAVVWARPRLPLVAGEESSPMCRALLIADSGSGVSAVLDATRFMFINVDLTVVLHRDPAGEWLLLDAATTIGDQGTGLARTTLADQHGSCGGALQTLMVSPR
jgi:hypothetical protein